MFRNDIELGIYEIDIVDIYVFGWFDIDKVVLLYKELFLIVMSDYFCWCYDVFEVKFFGWLNV